MKLGKIKKIYSEENLQKLAGAYNNNTKRKIFIGAIVAFCVIFSIIFLYQPARDLYVASRQNDKLTAQYEALKATNNNLQQDIEQLQTEEGIKQKATDTLGLIENGDSIGYVLGEDYDDARDDSASSTSSKLAFKNIKTPITWYSPVLDFIFNYHD